MKVFKYIATTISFLLIVILLFIVTNNTIHTNRIIEKSINSLLYHSIDSTLTELTFEKFKIGAIKTKNYILDSNTISYLFQVLTILIIGIGLYLLVKIQDKIEVIERNKLNILNFIKKTKYSTSIINTLNTILTLSTDLNENITLSDLNLIKTYHIENQLDIINSLLTEFKSYSLNAGEQSYCKNVFEDIVLRKIEILYQANNYYQIIWDKVNVIIDLLNNMKIDNSGFDNVYKS